MASRQFGEALRKAAERVEGDARREKYKIDPVLWAEERAGLILWSKQKEILTSIAKHKRTAVKSCHSIGKTFISAVAAGWWVDTRLNSMVQSTAPTYDQVHAQLWEEIRKLHTSVGLPGSVNEQDQWKRPMVNEGTGRMKNILVGQGRLS